MVLLEGNAENSGRFSGVFGVRIVAFQGSGSISP